MGAPYARVVKETIITMADLWFRSTGTIPKYLGTIVPKCQHPALMPTVVEQYTYFLFRITRSFRRHSVSDLPTMTSTAALDRISIVRFLAQPAA